MVGEPPGLWCGFISQAGIERFLSEGFLGSGFQEPSAQGIYWSFPDAGGGWVERVKGFQRKYLRGLAHGMKPVVLIGRQGITDGVVHSVDQALQQHELIKLKFIDFKEKDQKTAMAAVVENKTDCEMVGMIGHTGIFFRAHHDPEKRKIVLPKDKQ